MSGITQNRQKSIIFMVLPKQKKQKSLWLLMGGSDNNKESDNSENSNNNDNDKDSISDKDNNNSVKVT